MYEETIARFLCTATDQEITYAFLSAWEDYMEYLADIASDIYDSCIKYYYATYTPKKYDRHGDLDGFNLYRANAIEPYQLTINFSINEDLLLPYTGREKRKRVLETVMDGIRGGGVRRKQFRGWPRSWVAHYPNRYSEFSGEWSSKSSTIDSILEDFVSTCVEDTKSYFYVLMCNYIG